VTVVQNLRLNEFTKAIVEFAEDNGHGDIAVLVVMSHGEPGEASGKIIASDGQKVDIENDIIRYFNNHCLKLRGKPKLFIFQACNGKERDTGVRADGWMGAAVPTSQRPAVSRRGPSLPSVSDIMIATSTVPGHVSWRSSARGSYFIQDLCQVFMENCHNTHLEKMLKMVSLKLQEREFSEDGYKQCMEWRNRGFNKELYFHPQMNTASPCDKYVIE